MIKNLFLLFVICFFTFGCSKKDSSSNNSGTPGGGSTFALGLDGDCGSTFSFDGTAMEIQEVCPSGYGYGGYPDSIAVDFLSTLLDQVNGENSITFRYGTWRGTSLATEAQFRALFTTGTKTFTEELSDGVIITMEINGEEYRSDWGSGNQTGSTLIIDDLRFFDDQGVYSVKVDARFNCKVYNTITSNSVTITNGRFVGTFANWIN